MTVYASYLESYSQNNIGQNYETPCILYYKIATRSECIS